MTEALQRIQGRRQTIACCTSWLILLQVIDFKIVVGDQSLESGRRLKWIGEKYRLNRQRPSRMLRMASRWIARIFPAAGHGFLLGTSQPSDVSSLRPDRGKVNDGRLPLAFVNMGLEG